MAKVYCSPDIYSEKYSEPKIYLGDEIWNKICQLKKSNLGSLSIHTDKVTRENDFSVSFGSLFSASYDEKKSFVTICCTVSESYSNPNRHDGPDAIQFGYGFYVGLVVEDKGFNCDGFGTIRANIKDHHFTCDVQFIGLNKFFNTNPAAKLCQNIIIDGTSGGAEALDNLVVGSQNLMKLLNEAKDDEITPTIVSYTQHEGS